MTSYIKRQIELSKEEPPCDSDLISMLKIDEEKYKSAKLNKSNKRALGRIVIEYGLDGIYKMHKQHLLKYRGCGKLFLDKLEFMGLWKMPPKDAPITKKERSTRNRKIKKEELISKIKRASLKIKKWEEELITL